jgi:hypothetical protein
MRCDEQDIECNEVTICKEITCSIFYSDVCKPKLLSVEVKNSRVILQIVLPLPAKALYKFGFFEGIL